MCKICVFAGTTEGRKIVRYLCRRDVRVTACVATEYGETLLEPEGNLTVSSRRMEPEEMAAMLKKERFDLVLDATHPYARVVTENILAACTRTDTEYLRILREESALSEDAVYVSDIAAAVEYLNGVEGAILLTTGSKELLSYTAVRDFADRVYARVLPMESSLAACQQAGLKPARILAMQGPFTEEMNLAMIRATGAKLLVTKDGGDIGGFAAKASAARKAGCRLVVIGRPEQQAGVTLSETMKLLEKRFSLKVMPRVSIVGIGPGSRTAMTADASRAIRGADCLIGAKRMLDATAAPEQARVEAIAPGTIADFIHSHPEYVSFAVVMSGDTGFFSGTRKLLPLLADCAVEVIPGLSSLSYLCSRLGTSYEDVKTVSLHGRDHDIVPDVRRNARVFSLVGGENGMKDLCAALADAGLGNVQVSIGENLSYPNEKITAGTAEELKIGTFAPLCAALIENPHPDAVVTHGLPDAAFQRSDGENLVPMTKSEVRSVCLSKLQLTQNAVCWDIGAGTGSVAIEMALQATRGAVYAVERRADAVALLEENKQKFHAGNLHIVSGTAPANCEELPAPSHVFIGGSSGNMASILDLVHRMNPRARIVATAIALETVGELTDCAKNFPGMETEVVCLQVARSRKAGAYHLMTGSNPIYIFTMHFGGEAT